MFRRREWTVLDSVVEKHGGTIVEKRLGTVVDYQLRLVVDSYDVEVTMRVSVESDMILRATWRINVPPPGTTTFKIYPEGFVSFVSKALGGTEVELGVPAAFDHMFMIKAHDVAALRRMWTLEHCQLMLATYSTSTIRGHDDVIELEWQGLLETPVDVMRGVELLVALARADLYGMAALMALPDATRTPAGVVAIAGPGEIQVGPYRSEDRVVTRASGRVVIDGEHQLPDAVGAAAIRCEDGETTITFPAIVEDPVRLVAVIEFLRRFAAPPSDGVFR